MTEFRECIARYELEGEPHCTHPASGYTKKPVTPDICKKCRVYTGLLRDLPKPDLMTRVKSAGKAILDAARHPKPSPAEEVARREAICNACKYKQENWCAACGCNLHAKQRMLTWRCDLGFWDQSPEVGTSGSSPPVVDGPDSGHSGG